MIPPQVKSMLAVPGLYLVSNPEDDGFAVVFVNRLGEAVQMTIDGLLADDRWNPDVQVRGPLNPFTPPLEPKSGHEEQSPQLH